MIWSVAGAGEHECRRALGDGARLARAIERAPVSAAGGDEGRDGGCDVVGPGCGRSRRPTVDARGGDYVGSQAVDVVDGQDGPRVAMEQCVWEALIITLVEEEEVDYTGQGRGRCCRCCGRGVLGESRGEESGEESEE